MSEPEKTDNAVPPTPVADEGLYSPDVDAIVGDEPQSVTWTASEFIAHEKSMGWYAGLVVADLALAGLVFLLTRDFLSVAVVVISAILLGVYGSHQPRQLEYSLDDTGFTVGGKRFEYDDFRSFSVIPEGAFSSVVLMPLRRFAFQTAMHYPPEQEELILQLLSDRLPFEEPSHDVVTSLMRRIRF